MSRALDISHPGESPEPPGAWASRTAQGAQRASSRIAARIGLFTFVSSRRRFGRRP
jgi:hypothetical protein